MQQDYYLSIHNMLIVVPKLLFGKITNKTETIAPIYSTFATHNWQVAVPIRKTGCDKTHHAVTYSTLLEQLPSQWGCTMYVTCDTWQAAAGKGTTRDEAVTWWVMRLVGTSRERSCSHVMFYLQPKQYGQLKLEGFQFSMQLVFTCN